MEGKKVNGFGGRRARGGIRSAEVQKGKWTQRPEVEREEVDSEGTATLGT